MSGIIDRIKNLIAWETSALRPVDPKKIVFTSYYGAGFGDSPRQIAEAVHRKAPDMKLVWLVKDEAARSSLPEWITCCDYNSTERIRELSTAKVWVDNCRKGAMKKRASQIYVQTWHGFALKRIEKDIADTLPSDYEAYAIRDSRQTDLIVSDSAFMSELYRKSFWYNGEVAEFGSPRNDALVHPEESVAAKVKSYFGLPEDRKLVCYAPTFRKDRSAEAYSVDFSRLKAACEKRFGGNFAVLIRLHPAVLTLADGLEFDNETTFNATPYPDIQELLAVSDVVITDYSSLMFDYMLTGRPCLQYASDIDAYRNDRNFNFSLDLLPFPLAEDNDQLERLILSFDEEDYSGKLEDFKNKFGIKSDGLASERCADWILEKMKG